MNPKRLWINIRYSLFNRFAIPTFLPPFFYFSAPFFHFSVPFFHFFAPFFQKKICPLFSAPFFFKRRYVPFFQLCINFGGKGSGDNGYGSKRVVFV